MADCLSVLEEAYPPRWAESWDAVGLSVGERSVAVERVLFAVDPTIEIAKEARDYGAQLLVTHHPLFLRGVHGVPTDTPGGAVVQTLNFATIAGGLMILAGALHRRLGSTDLTSLGGLASAFPRLSALFLVLGYAGLRIASRSDDRFHRYLAAGVTSWFMVQTLINLGVVLRLLPVAGVPLPLLSYGGSALMANVFAVGVLITCARYEPAARKLLSKAPKPIRPEMTTVVDGRVRKRANRR